MISAKKTELKDIYGMTRSQIRKYAFIKSIPIMCSYIFVSMAYGIMMEEAGFKWYYSLLVSLTVYTGAFQFVLVTFLSRWMQEPVRTSSSQ